MKRKLVIFSVVMVLCANLAFAGAERSWIRMTALGTISQDGKTFVSDADHTTWTIANPGAIKGHEGHHVRLTGNRLDAKGDSRGGGQIRVIAVKLSTGQTNPSKHK